MVKLNTPGCESFTARTPPHGVAGPPQQYSTRSPQSSALCRSMDSVTMGKMSTPGSRMASTNSKGDRGAMDTPGVHVACMARRCQGAPRHSFQAMVAPTDPPMRTAVMPIVLMVSTTRRDKVSTEPQAPGPRSTNPTQACPGAASPTTNSAPQRTQAEPTTGGTTPQSSVGSEPGAIVSQAGVRVGVKEKLRRCHCALAGAASVADAKAGPPPRGRSAVYSSAPAGARTHRKPS